jgi:hypothetical protein
MVELPSSSHGTTDYYVQTTFSKQKNHTKVFWMMFAGMGGDQKHFERFASMRAAYKTVLDYVTWLLGVLGTWWMGWLRMKKVM